MNNIPSRVLLVLALILVTVKGEEACYGPYQENVGAFAHNDLVYMDFDLDHAKCKAWCNMWDFCLAAVLDPKKECYLLKTRSVGAKKGWSTTFKNPDCTGSLVDQIYISLPDKFFAPTTGKIWLTLEQPAMGKRPLTRCTTNTLFNGMPKQGKWYSIIGVKKIGCLARFIGTRPMRIYVHNDSINDVFINKMTLSVGRGTRRWRRSGSNYVAIDKYSRGYYTTD